MIESEPSETGEFRIRVPVLRILGMRIFPRSVSLPDLDDGICDRATVTVPYKAPQIDPFASSTVAHKAAHGMLVRRTEMHKRPCGLRRRSL
jgi:hypothetical protein